MSNETKFVGGMIAKAPNENAPEYVKAKLSIKREELIAFLQGESGEWVNVEIKEGRSGKWYAAVDTWQPNQSSQPRQQAPARQEAPVHPPRDSFDDSGFNDDDIPF